MVIQISVKNPEGLKKGDILVFDGKSFDVITKEEIIKEIKKDLKALEDKVEGAVVSIHNTRNAIKLRQKRFIEAFVKGE